MRILIVIAPAFFTWPLALARRLKSIDPSIQLIGVVATRHIYDKVKKEGADIDWLRLDCLEDVMRDILDKPYDQAELIRYENMLGNDIVNNILINDRQVGRAFVAAGAAYVETEFTQKTQTNDQIRAYMTGIMKYADELCQSCRIDVGLFYAVASSASQALAELIRYHGGHIFRIEHTRIDNRHMIDYAIDSQLLPIWKRYLNNEEGSAASKAQAATWLATYRDSLKEEPDYMQYYRMMINKSYGFVGIIKGILKSTARFFLYGLIKGQKPLYAETGWQKLKTSFILPYNYIRLYKFTKFRSLEEQANTPFIYFPLHVDPESSTQQLAPDHVNQLTIIEALSKRKPMHMDIIVKEHPMMLGLRPANFYKTLRSFPGVHMVHPSLPSRMLIQKSAMVATITGTVGWEAILVKKPTIAFGLSPFRNFKKGIVYSHDLSTLGASIQKALNGEPLEESEILRYLSIAFDESFPMNTTDLWGNTDGDIARDYATSLENVTRQIFQRYEEVTKPKNSLRAVS